MLVERGLQVMNAEAVSDAYSIAANYLRRTGAMSDTFVTNERLPTWNTSSKAHGKTRNTPSHVNGSSGM